MHISLEIVEKSPGIARSVGTDITEPMGFVPHKDWILEYYHEITVADLADHSSPIVAQWKKDRFDLITICGEGDVSLDAIDTAIESLVDGGLLAFTINLKKIKAGNYGEFIESLPLGNPTALWKGMREVRRKIFDHQMNVKRERVGYAAFIYQKVGWEEKLLHVDNVEQLVMAEQNVQQKVYEQVQQQDNMGQQDTVSQQHEKLRQHERVGQQDTVSQQHEMVNRYHEKLHQRAKTHE